MSISAQPESLRVLCLDGGGIKGYTSLLILKRIFRTLMAEGRLSEVPKPSEVFDLIIGTSTGGLIAVMLGRLNMTIDECITAYEQLGSEVFGRRPRGGKFGKVMKGLRSAAYYDVENLQEAVRKILDSKGVPRDTEFRESGTPSCKVMLCVTRSKVNRPDVLRSYESVHPTAENYDCSIWEAASATAAAPLFFQGVQFDKTGEMWCDGGLRRNNPINEAMAELTRETDWKGRKIGCVLSLGTGVKGSKPLSSSLRGVLKGAVAIMTDSDDIARVFASSELGVELFRTHRYFRFSVPQGMQDLKMDEWKEIERMRALTTDYLGHAGNGDLLTRCVKSLIDPDENIHIGLEPKLSLIPHRTCPHLIHRPAYSEALLSFFRYKTQVAQIFVLWGLGGIGKTQVALKFAHTVQHRFPVFWIRADRFTNFASDYTRLLEKLDPTAAEGNQATADISTLLDKTRRKLEEDHDNWLIILDNADDLETFLGESSSSNSEESLSISRFLPRHGRLLITTRDRRFQGRVAAASDGMKVGPLTKDEAKELLIRSIPTYLLREGLDTMLQAEELVKELGYLPLAIAQAAANILERQLTLSEYVNFYRDKKQRMGLMEAPAHDFQTTDPRNASQSVKITWQISFDLLKDMFPQSAVFLTYIGCFHWRNIPGVLIRKLPEFRDLPDSEFLLLARKSINLSLLEEEETEPGFAEYIVHPLLHEQIISRIPQEELRPYLQHLVDVVWAIFPRVEERTDAHWNIAVYLAPHAARVIELCEDAAISNKQLSVLLLRTSQFSGVSNLFSTAVDLAEKATIMGRATWSSSPEMVIAFLTNESHQLNHASRLAEAERTTQEALDWLKSESVKSCEGYEAVERQRIGLQSILSSTLMGKDDAKREAIHRAQLASGLVDEWSSQGVSIRHNLAHALLGQSKIDEARSLNAALLDYAVTEAGRRDVTPRVHLIMLNLRGRILRRTQFFGDKEYFHGDPESIESRDERLQLHRLVFEVSLEQLGIEDVDTWKATMNLVGCLHEHNMHSESGEVLYQVLPAGIANDVKAEGSFTITLANVTGSAQDYLAYLEDIQTPSTETTTAKFRQLLQQWILSSGSSGTRPTDSQINNSGVNFQQRGMFDEAELQHIKAIEICQNANEPVPPVYRYNLMLLMGRQGRVVEATAYRARHKTEVEALEAAIGTLEDRLEKDALDLQVHKEAQSLLDAGKLIRGGEWWLAHEGELRRAERRYGVLKSRFIEEPKVDGSKRNPGFRLGLGLRTKRHV